jgi:hypothetical protein
MIPGAVHGSPGIYLTDEKNPVWNSNWSTVVLITHEDKQEFRNISSYMGY